MQVPLTLHDVLVRMVHNCPELQGAAVATGDGLVLAARGLLEGDTPAACAANLSDQLEESLSLIHSTRMDEMLLWCTPGLWYLIRAAHGHLLLAYAASAEHAGAVRLAGQIAAQHMAPMLTPRIE